MTKLIEYEQASDEVRAVYDDIRATRQNDYINNFWKAIANHPPTLLRTWQTVKEVMTSPGELDPLMRELIYIAVSVTNGCDYCIASHTTAARTKGMNDVMFGELMANRHSQHHKSPCQWLSDSDRRAIQDLGAYALIRSELVTTIQTAPPKDLRYSRIALLK